MLCMIGKHLVFRLERQVFGYFYLENEDIFDLQNYLLIVKLFKDIKVTK